MYYVRKHTSRASLLRHAASTMS